MKGDNIANRLLDLAIASLQLAGRIEGTPTGKHIARQLIRCSTSTGANYEEARSAESPADFAHKVGIAAKEVGETAWWLRITDRARLAPSEDTARWLREARELVAILTASARTARKRIPATATGGRRPGAQCPSPVAIAVGIVGSSDEEDDVDGKIHNL